MYVCSVSNYVGQCYLLILKDICFLLNIFLTQFRLSGWKEISTHRMHLISIIVFILAIVGFYVFLLHAPLALLFASYVVVSPGVSLWLGTLPLSVLVWSTNILVFVFFVIGTWTRWRKRHRWSQILQLSYFAMHVSSTVPNVLIKRSSYLCSRWFWRCPPPKIFLVYST